MIEQQKQQQLQRLKHLVKVDSKVNIKEKIIEKKWKTVCMNKNENVCCRYVGMQASPIEVQKNMRFGFSLSLSFLSDFVAFSFLLSRFFSRCWFL